MSARLTVTVKETSDAMVVAAPLIARASGFEFGLGSRKPKATTQTRAVRDLKFLDSSSSSTSAAGSDLSSYMSSYSSSQSTAAATRRTRKGRVPASAQSAVDFRNRTQFKSAMKKAEKEQCRQLAKAAKKLSKVSKALMNDVATFNHLGRADASGFGSGRVAVGGVGGFKVVAPQVNGVAQGLTQAYAFAPAQVATAGVANVATTANVEIKTTATPIAQVPVATQVVETVQAEPAQVFHIAPTMVQQEVQQVVQPTVVQQEVVAQVPVQTMQPIQLQPIQLQQVQLQQVQVEEQKPFQVIVEEAQPAVATAVATAAVQPIQIQQTPVQFVQTHVAQVAVPEVVQTQVLQVQPVEAVATATTAAMPVFMVGNQPELVQNAQVVSQMPYHYVVSLKDGAAGFRTVQLASTERYGSEQLNVWCKQHVKTISKALRMVEAAMYDSYKAGITHAGYPVTSSSASSPSDFTSSSSSTSASSGSSSSSSQRTAAATRRRA